MRETQTLGEISARILQPPQPELLEYASVELLHVVHMWQERVWYMAYDAALAKTKQWPIADEHIRQMMETTNLGEFRYGVTKRHIIHSTLNEAVSVKLDGYEAIFVAGVCVKVDSCQTHAWKQYQLDMEARYGISSAQIMMIHAVDEAFQVNHIVEESTI